MNFRISTVTVCAMAFFSSQVMLAESFLLSDLPEAPFVCESPIPATDSDTVFYETTVSQVKHYNNILSKTVTTVERNDTVSKPTVRWNLAFNIAALSGDKNDNIFDNEALSFPPLTKFDAKYPTVYVGMVDNSSDAFALDLTRSFECGMYLFKGGWSFTKDFLSHTFGVTTALGFSRTMLALDDKDVFYVDDKGMTVCSPMEGMTYHKPRMTYWSYRVPVSLQWMERTNRSTTFFSVGVEAEYRHHIRSYVSVKGDANHRIASHSLAVLPWSCNYLLQVGRGSWGFIWRGSLTEFFNKKSTDLGGRTVMFAISLAF